MRADWPSRGDSRGVEHQIHIYIYIGMALKLYCGVLVDGTHIKSRMPFNLVVVVLVVVVRLSDFSEGR